MEGKDVDKRYYIDIDLETKKIIKCSFGDRFELVAEKLPVGVHRVYLTEGQFNKLYEKLPPIY